jgi:parallel beta-helix repeat protein
MLVMLATLILLTHTSNFHRDHGNSWQTRVSSSLTPETTLTPTPAPTPAGTIYYVDKALGNDNNPGTEKRPFSTIRKAAENLSPGDAVYVKNGTYDEGWDGVKITRSGNSINWIIFKAFPEHRPLVTSAHDGTFTVEANYIEINGFEIIQTTQGSGIHVGKGNHHTRVMNNIIHHCGCGGISGQETDYLHIEGNITHHNAFTSPWQCSGISIYQAKAFDNKSGFHNVIRGNISYSNENRVANREGKITDGNGIIIDDFRHTQSRNLSAKYTASTLIENNIIFDNGGRGIHVFYSDNVVVRNNTIFKNLKTSQLDGQLNGELSTLFSSNILIFNNIVYSNNMSKQAFIDDYSNNNYWDYNLAYQGNIQVKNGHSGAVLGSHNLRDVDPQFINPSIEPAVANFHLQPTSPAIDAGTSMNVASTDFDGNTRPSGSRYDIGAYEFNSETTGKLSKKKVRGLQQ